MPIKTNLKDMTPRRDKFSRKAKLLSGGYSCPQAFPNGEIVIYPWDSEVDTWLTDLRKKQDQSDLVMFSILERIANLNGCPIQQFVSGDVLPILMISRSIQSDCVIAYASRCSACGFEEEGKIIVPDELQVVGTKPVNYTGKEAFTLPMVQDVVELRPLLVGDEVNIMTRTPESKEMCSDAIARMLTMIVTVNGERPDNMIELVQWYRAIPPKDVKFLEDSGDNITPHFDLEIPHKCERCGNVYTWPLDVGPEFFRSGRAGKVTPSLAKGL
jgi:hypothetical protein